MKMGGPVVGHFLFYFPEDANLFAEETTYMLGDSIKVSPVLIQGLNNTGTYPTYVPKGQWIDLNDNSVVVNSIGQYVNLTASSS